MKLIIRIVLFIGITLSATSCITMMAIAHSQKVAREQGKYFGAESAEMTMKTFQRIAGHAALATTGKGDVACIIANFDNYYDGMVISGYFSRKGTYSYISNSGANRTVLVYLFEQDKTDLENYVEDFLREGPEVVVEAPSGISI